jgi:CheY-like chemotaxis protein
MHDTDCTVGPPPRSAKRWVRQRVLVVDDDRDSAEVVAEMLAVAGHETKFVLDGASAIAMAKMFLPQLIVLDIELRDMDGREVARQLRLEASLSGVILVALTGWSGARWEREAREAGFDHYFIKPVQFLVLKELLGA